MISVKPLGFLLSLCAGLVAFHPWALPSTSLAPVPPTMVESITPTELRMHLEFLASDELGGRYTLSPNFPVVARYLASNLRAYDFQGGGDHGDFLQSFPVISSKPVLAKSSFTLTRNGRGTDYAFGDFFPSQASGTGEASGQVIFVGMGISSRSQHHDDYANVDVKGKIVLLAGISVGVEQLRLSDDEQSVGAAQAHGALA